MNENTKIIDSEEYVDIKTASDLLKIKLNKSRILVDKNLIYKKIKQRIWISKKSLSKRISYEKGLKTIKDDFSNIIKKHEKILQKNREGYQNSVLELRKKHYPELYPSVQKEPIIIPKSKYLYYPILYKRITTLHLSPQLRNIFNGRYDNNILYMKISKNNNNYARRIFLFVGDLLYPDITAESLLEITNIGKVSIDSLIKELNQLNLKLGDRQNYYWPYSTSESVNTKINNYYDSRRGWNEDYCTREKFINQLISQYKKQREQEQAEIENLIRANNPSKSLTPLD